MAGPAVRRHHIGGKVMFEGRRRLCDVIGEGIKCADELTVPVIASVSMLLVLLVLLFAPGILELS